MKNKRIDILFLLLMLGCFMYVGSLFLRVPSSVSPFQLQQEYAKHLENKLTHLLEPAVGFGNVRTSVKAEITHKDIIQKQFNPFTFTETKIHQQGPVLEKQAVSVLINEKDKNKLPVYQNLIESAVGYDAKRGDRLNIEILPFIKVPLWTLGLNPMHLVYLAIVFSLLIIIGIFLLIKEKRKSVKVIPPTQILNQPLWNELEKIPAEQLAEKLQKKRPEITATILQKIPHEKASELMEFFDIGYKNQISLHLDYIEKLGIQSYLLKKAEKTAYQILKESWGKTPLHQLLNYSDEEIQNLLHYIHKKDFMNAIQTAELSVQQIFKRNIPPALWQEFLQSNRVNPCTKQESLQAQEKIIQLAELLKKVI